MTQSVTLKVEPRTAVGTGAARELRRRGEIPGVIYGHGREPESLRIPQAELEKMLAGAGGSTVIELEFSTKKVQALVREIQRHPTRLNIVHVDFLEVHAGETLTVHAPIRLVGSPEGVRNQGGVLDQIMRELEIKVLPRNMPDHIDVDVQDLGVGHSIHVRDIAVPDAEILEDLDATVCTVVPPRVIEAEAVVVPEEEVEEMLEPELIRKPREEAEGGERKSAEQEE